MFQFVKSETGYFSKLKFSMDLAEHSALRGTLAFEEAAFLQCSIGTCTVHMCIWRVCRRTQCSEVRTQERFSERHWECVCVRHDTKANYGFGAGLHMCRAAHFNIALVLIPIQIHTRSIHLHTLH